MKSVTDAHITTYSITVTGRLKVSYTATDRTQGVGRYNATRWQYHARQVNDIRFLVRPFANSIYSFIHSFQEHRTLYCTIRYESIDDLHWKTDRQAASSCASISLHGWGDTRVCPQLWREIDGQSSGQSTPPLLSSSHSPSFSPPAGTVQGLTAGVEQSHELN